MCVKLANPKSNGQMLAKRRYNKAGGCNIIEGEREGDKTMLVFLLIFLLKHLYDSCTNSNPQNPHKNVCASCKPLWTKSFSFSQHYYLQQDHSGLQIQYKQNNWKSTYKHIKSKVFLLLLIIFSINKNFLYILGFPQEFSLIYIPLCDSWKRAALAAAASSLFTVACLV